MPRVEIKQGKKILAVAERSHDITIETIEDFELKTPQKAVTMPGTTIVLKGKHSEIKLFPQDVEKLKEVI